MTIPQVKKLEQHFGPRHAWDVIFKHKDIVRIGKDGKIYDVRFYIWNDKLEVQITPCN